MSRALALAAVLVLSGCGSRTGLSDTPRDAGPPPDPELCNGVDDDLDGVVDEGIAEQRCGVGACEASAPGCEAGVVPACIPGRPGMEGCGGGDDDCDGRVDEGLGFGPLSDPIFVTDPGVELGPFNTDLSATSAGLLAFYRVSFDGSAPMPNLFTVALDPDGRATREPTVLIPRPVTNGPRVVPSTPGRLAFVYCGRVTGTGEDFTTAQTCDEDGAATGTEVVREGVDPSCGATDPEILWTGERHLIVWTDNRGGSSEVDFEPQLEVADESLANIAFRSLTEDRVEGDLSASPRFGINGPRILLAYGMRPLDELRRSELRLQALNLVGGDAGRRVSLGPPPPAPDREVASWGALAIVPRADGFLLLSSDRAGEGLLALDVGPDGQPIGAARRVAGWDERVSHLRAEPRPGGGAYLAVSGGSGESYLARLDGSGALIDRFSIDIPGEHTAAWPAIARRDDRVFVSWTRLGETEAQLFVRGFGCVP